MNPESNDYIAASIQLIESYNLLPSMLVIFLCGISLHLLSFLMRMAEPDKRKTSEKRKNDESVSSSASVLGGFSSGEKKKNKPDLGFEYDLVIDEESRHFSSSDEWRESVAIRPDGSKVVTYSLVESERKS